MEYSENAFVKDFVARTKENISCGKNPNEVTQLINSLIGLLILPKERYYRNIKNSIIEPELLDRIKACVKIKPKQKRLDLKYIIRRMRNAIAHFHIDFTTNSNTREISEIIFSDYDDDKIKTPNFQISLPVDLVKQFVYQFSDAISKTNSV